MPLICPACSQPSLTISVSLELPPDARWDEIAVQAVTCTGCGFSGGAVYLESRRGAPDSETVAHTGYPLSAEDAAAWQKMLHACRTPQKTDCDCATHRQLNRRDSNGIWELPAALDGATGFPIIFRQ